MSLPIISVIIILAESKLIQLFSTDWLRISSSARVILLRFILLFAFLSLYFFYFYFSFVLSSCLQVENPASASASSSLFFQDVIGGFDTQNQVRTALALLSFGLYFARLLLLTYCTNESTVTNAIVVRSWGLSLLLLQPISDLTSILSTSQHNDDVKTNTLSGNGGSMAPQTPQTPSSIPDIILTGESDSFF